MSLRKSRRHFCNQGRAGPPNKPPRISLPSHLLQQGNRACEPVCHDSLSSTLPQATSLKPGDAAKRAAFLALFWCRTSHLASANPKKRLPPPRSDDDLGTRSASMCLPQPLVAAVAVLCCRCGLSYLIPCPQEHSGGSNPGDTLAKAAVVMLCGCALVLLDTVRLVWQSARGRRRLYSSRVAASVVASAFCIYLIRTGYPRFADRQLNTVSHWVSVPRPLKKSLELHRQLTVIDMHAGQRATRYHCHK